MPTTKGKRKMKIKKAVSANSIVLHRRYVSTIAKTASDAGYAYSLDLSLFNASDILSLFSEYRIKQVKISFQLVNAPNNNASFPRLHIAHRGFSNVNPTSRNEVLQYNGLKQYQYGPANIAAVYTFKPYVWRDTVTTASGTGKEIVVSPWIATDSDTVRHNYCVTWMDRYNSTTDNTHTIETLVDIVVEARGPR